MPADLATLFAAETPEARVAAAKAWADTLKESNLVRLAAAPLASCSPRPAHLMTRKFIL